MNTNHLSPSLLTWLRCFDAVARHNSFTLAAKELHVTQGSVSQQVKKLEEYLGVPLFYREGKSLSLTREGARLSLVSEQSFETLNQAVGKLRRDQRSTNAPLNLSCSPSFAMLWLTPRVSDLLQGKSGVTVRIYGEYHMLDRVGMGLSGIQAGIRFDPGHYVDLNEEMFLDEWIIPVTTPEFLARHPDIRSIADVAPGMMLHDENPWHSATQNVEWNTWLEAMDAPPSKPGGVYFNLSQLAMVAALTGQGIAMGRLALVYDELKSGRLVAPFPCAVKSKASYRFISGQKSTDTNEHLRQWLHATSDQFKLERNELLEQMGIECRQR
ncbi:MULTISPECIES: LysR family transcriptional regulator [Comamonas]|jgi:DNA-binding transcriptional LysR family regulator|uniref:LysR family transcriptional regulator n=1 Tax=Comamonas terrigena TaxID=32013 RepID=A0A2A7USH4_COMTR|nr:MULTISPECIES: LysR family transcriptional regulator [Comamonas]MBD9533260.1 LysR family transcriptional regulator [Comamonas sp. CMM01]MDH0047987.1 LysR family transcriptional regulator [Comamonas terrigena]MDH0510413.1 LysR family transcriptional regulator [Comamonas terrigena]MDH1090015.1 LysR family transcriptional regulator [Comamonas terrigena]MDH1290214.1 LysR family transcriptional regulator [Comamonas terrigena]